jgi:tetratricopeptide (TPR) repeat protein
MHDARSDRPRTSSVSEEARQNESKHALFENDSLEGIPSDAETLVNTGAAEALESHGAVWRSAWQIPVILASTVLILGGFFTLKNSQASQADPKALFEIVQQRIVEGRLDEARVMLAKAVRAADDTGTYDTNEGRILLAQADLESRQPERLRNDQRVLSSYEGAQASGMTLTPEQEARRASALAALGQYDAAFAGFESGHGLDAPGEVRQRLLRLLVTRAKAGEHELVPRLLRQLDEASAAPEVPLSDAAWSLFTAADLRLQLSETERDPALLEDGLDHLLRGMRRLDARLVDVDSELVRADWIGPLHSVLGRLWLASGEMDSARTALGVALETLPPGDSEHSRAEAGMAWLQMSERNFEEAIAGFDLVLARNPDPVVRLEVSLLRAEAHAAFGNHPGALADYQTVLAGLAGPDDPLGAKLASSLGDQVRAAVIEGRPQEAIQFSAVLDDSGRLDSDHDILEYSARAHRVLAASLFGHDKEDLEPLFSVAMDSISQEDRRTASLNFRRAGELYGRLAVRIIGLDGGAENWSRAQAASGRCFDLGADRERAVEAYLAYLEVTGSDDSRRAEIAYRYAKVLHSQLEFEPALEAYDELVEVHGSGVYSASARVESARCLVALGRPQEARSRLEPIVTGVAGIGPEAIEYQEARFALSRLLYEMGAGGAAISMIDATIRRYSDDPRVPNLAFLLGSAHEQAAEVMRTRHENTGLGALEREEALSGFTAHAESAAESFGLVIQALGEQSPDSLVSLDADMLRDAFVGRADAVFDLGRHELCIPMYEEIERRYRSEATSLDALVRLDECWSALGDDAKARKAHRRAELRLQQLPEEAFGFPASRFDRDSWQVWLERRPMRSIRAGVTE